MNDHDLRRLLDDHVDGIVGPERSAPPFVPTDAASSTRSGSDGRPRRIVLAVSALAAAAAVTVAAVAVTQWTLRTDPTPRIAAPPSPSAPATPPASSAPPPTASSPGPDASTQRPTGSTSSAPGTASGRTSNPTDPSGSPTSLGDARLVIPVGWTVTPRPGTVFAASWCLQPAGGDCTISFNRLDPDGSQGLDVDVPGGLDANPQYCDPTGTDNRTEGDTGVRELGGQEAEWRRWTFTCGDERTVRVEQYVVASAPGYVLVSEQADAETSAVMAGIAAASTLPDAERPVRLVDRGIVRSVTPTAEGVRIELDRIYLDPDASGGISNVNPATYRYLIPTAVVDALGADLEVGGRYRLTSDGEQITRVDAE